MSEVVTKPDAIAASRAFLKQLEANFEVFRNASPLAIGIDKQVIAQVPDVEKKILRLALRSHTQSTRYLKSMEKGTVRLNLDNSEADAVTEEQRAHAATLLRERFKKKAEQKRAQEAEAKAEQLRQHKLSQLAEKFGRKSN
jgi:ProP effector